MVEIQMSDLSAGVDGGVSYNIDSGDHYVSRSHTHPPVARRKSKYLKSRHVKNQADPEKVKKEIMGDILGDIDMTDSSEEGHMRRAEELRSKPIHLSLKRTIQKNLDNRLGVSSTLQSTSFKSGTIRNRIIRHRVNDVTSSLGLWDGHLKAVQGFFGTDVASYFVFLRWLFLSNMFMGVIVLGFLIVPQLIYRMNNSIPYSSTFNGINIVSGEGWFNSTELLYGGYGNSANSLPQYDMPLAYLSTNLVYFIVFFLVIAISLARSYRLNFIEGSGNLSFYYVQMVLGGWDFGISNASTAKMKKTHILREFREFLATERAEQGSPGHTCSLLLLRLALACFQLILVAIAGWAVHALVVRPTEWFHMDLVLIISLVNLFLPFIFSVCARQNRFHNEKNVLYSSLVMTSLLYAMTMGVFLYTKLSNCTNSSCVDSCWESDLGSSFYQLVILDFLLVVLVTILTTGVRRLVSKFCIQKLGAPEFNIARNTVYLLYSQFLCWLGLYYAPVLAIVAVIKFFLLFYMNRLLVTVACIPSSRPWRAARMTTVFLVMLFVGFLLCVAGIGLSVWVTNPSGVCGPFTSVNLTVDVVTNKLSDSDVKDFVPIIISPGFVVGLIVILCVVVHYTRVVSEGKKKLVLLLREQIRLESKDRVFLQSLLDTVHKRHADMDHEPPVDYGDNPRSSSGSGPDHSSRPASGSGPDHSSRPASGGGPNHSSRPISTASGNVLSPVRRNFAKQPGHTSQISLN